MSESWAEARAERRRDRVVHLWRKLTGFCGGPSCVSVDEAWCGEEESTSDSAPRVMGVGDDEIDQVTCEHCVGMASDFGGACKSRLREIVPAPASPAHAPEHSERPEGAVSAPVQHVARPAPGPAGRPRCEDYARCTVTVGELTVEPGLEIRASDGLEELWRQLREVAVLSAHLVTDHGWLPALDEIRARFERLWPGRAWFVEVHDVEGRWTQSYQPYGVPRSEDPAP